MRGGFVFYGGLLGGLFGIYLGGKILKIPVWEYAQNTIPVIPLAHGFGRLGCLMAGCCYGVPYDGAGAIAYTTSIAAPLNTPLFPVQGLEAVCEFMVSMILCFYIAHCRKHKRKLYSVEIYLVCYACIRFVLEFLRYDFIERGAILGMSTSQWISIALIVIVVINRAWKSKKKSRI